MKESRVMSRPGGKGSRILIPDDYRVLTGKRFTTGIGLPERSSNVGRRGFRQFPLLPDCVVKFNRPKNRVSPRL